MQSIRMIFALAAVLCVSAMPATAAEKVRLNYGPLSRTLPVRDLREFADTGKTSRKLRRYIKLSKQDPEKMRAGLTNSVEIDPVRLDRLLNSAPGNLLLEEVGEVIHTPSDRANRQALRSALILDASDDRQITLINTLEEYPTAEVAMEGDRLVKLLRQFNQFKAHGEEAEPLLNILIDRLGPLLR